MSKRFFLAAPALLAAAAIVFAFSSWRDRDAAARRGFVRANGARFVVDGKPFRFVGANVSVMYRDEDRARMPETLRQASQAGIKVVRVWAFGEGGPNDVKPMADFNDWPRTHSFRMKPGEWNEAAGSRKLNQPNDVVIADNGDIFIVQGHTPGPNGDARRIDQIGTRR